MTVNVQVSGANASNKNFFNHNNEMKVPSSKSKRIDSRKGILSRKDSINKNSFYQQKGKPDYLPNKPTVVGSRGDMPAAGYFNKNNPSQGGLPVINAPQQSSIAKNSALGQSRSKLYPQGQ